MKKIEKKNKKVGIPRIGVEPMTNGFQCYAATVHCSTN